MRGLVLNALRGLPDGETVLDRKSVERLWKDHVQLDKCIASLDEDGLIEILPGGGVRAAGVTYTACVVRAAAVPHGG